MMNDVPESCVMFRDVKCSEFRLSVHIASGACTFPRLRPLSDVLTKVSEIVNSRQERLSTISRSFLLRLQKRGNTLMSQSMKRRQNNPQTSIYQHSNERSVLPADSNSTKLQSSAVSPQSMKSILQELLKDPQA